MSGLADLLMRLERRLMAVEINLGIIPDKSDLLHPKSWAQAQTIETKKREAEIKEKP